LIYGVMIFIGIVLAFLASTVDYYHTPQKQGLFQASSNTISSYLLDGFRHWSGIHQVQRLRGPFHFYLPIVFIYKPLVVIGFAAALFHTIRKSRLFWLSTAAFFSTVVLVVAFVPDQTPFFIDLLRMRAWHIALELSLVFFGMWSILSLRSERKHFLAFWIFSGLVQFSLYSFVGEKVPWLTTHILLPWTIVAGVFWLACSIHANHPSPGASARQAL
jgi:predicted membrane-bound mannosyltransferase